MGKRYKVVSNPADTTPMHQYPGIGALVGSLRPGMIYNTTELKTVYLAHATHDREQPRAVRANNFRSAFNGAVEFGLIETKE